MKQIINGKIYNTDTATKVADDQDYDLCVTKNNQFFLYHRNWEDINLITKEQAQKFCGTWDTQVFFDVYEKYFEMVEG